MSFLKCQVPIQNLVRSTVLFQLVSKGTVQEVLCSESVLLLYMLCLLVLYVGNILVIFFAIIHGNKEHLHISEIFGSKYLK